LKEDYVPDIEKIQSRFNNFATKASLEGALNNIEDLKEYARKEFLHVKNEFIGVN